MRRRWKLALALVAIGTASAFMPMRIALDMAVGDKGPFGANAVRGTIWNAAIDGASLGSLLLGDVDAGLALLPLITGRAGLDFRPRAGTNATGLSGRVYRDLGGATGVTALNGGIDAGSLAGVAPLGRISFTNASAGFDAAGRCRDASGEAQIDIGAAIAGLPLSRGLSGPVSCDGDRVRLTLRGQSDMERADLSADRAGRYRVRFTVETGGDPLLGVALAVAGFRAETPGRFALVRTGQF